VIGAAVNTVNPSIMHFYAVDAASVCVIDSFHGDSARGDFPGDLHGAVRPMLKWNTRFTPLGREAVEMVED